MTESKNKTEAKDDQSKQAADGIEAVIADAGVGKDGKPQTKPSTSSDQSKPAKASKLGLFLIVVLFLIVASLGGLKLTGQLQPLYESLQAQLNLLSMEPSEKPQRTAHEVMQPQTRMQAIIPAAKQAQLQLEPSEPAAAVKPVRQAILPAAAVSPSNSPSVTSAEVGDLLVVIDQLRTEMRQLEDSQRTLHDGLLEQQQMNTQVRLRWIADPASRLPQMQLAWEEISLLPGLTAQQRQLALDMQALARADVQRLAQWKGSLQKWAEALVTPLHDDILPQPEQAWLAWVVGQFQLRQAPSAEAQHLADLRSRLLDAARQLSLESWPAQGAWQSLHAELLLQIKAMQNDTVDGAVNGESVVIETGLPLDFSAIQHDIIILRQAARQWSADDPQSIDRQQGGV